MNWKSKFLKKYNIYIILDTHYLSYRKIKDLAYICREEEVDFVQFRAKDILDAEFLRIAKVLNNIFKNSQTVFVVNDRIQISNILNCGLHVGVQDLPLEDTLKLCRKISILGFTVHNQQELRIANTFPLDYVSFGPVFSTPLKNIPAKGIEELLKIKRNSIHPVFAIGGINLENLKLLTKYQIRYIVISSSFCLSNKPQEFIRKVRKILNR
ncbi:MAG: hypothetical protein B6D55_05950 [Candidatus Omnitrophica bacterium 4484_70.2]|nr:MAG: hypothetical protein B6D55_05950 [Candidatus Omnitrophica bacterium 4484_70.2]